MKILIAIITALIVAGVVNLKNNSVKMYDYVDESERKSDFVNLAEVAKFEATENGLMLYFIDGSGYFIEK